MVDNRLWTEWARCLWDRQPSVFISGCRHLGLSVPITRNGALSLCEEVHVAQLLVDWTIYLLNKQLREEYKN